MPDLGTITALTSLVGAIRSLIGNVKDAPLRAELQDKVFHLQNHLLEMQPTLFSLQQENEELKRQLQNKADAKAFMDECIIRNGAYFKPNDDSTGYCGGCLSQGRIVPLAKGGIHGTCPVCNAKYFGLF